MIRGVDGRLSGARLVLDPIDGLRWRIVAAGLPAADDTSATAEAARNRFVDRLAAERPQASRPLAYRLTGRVQNGALAPLPEPLALVMTTNPSGYDLFFDQVRRGREQRASNLAAGRYRLEVAGPTYATAVLEVELAPEGVGAAVRVPLDPGPRYPFSGIAAAITRLAGVLASPDGAPWSAAGAGPLELEAVQFTPAGVALPVSERARFEEPRWLLLIDDQQVAYNAAGTATVTVRALDAAGQERLAIAGLTIRRGTGTGFVQTRIEGRITRPSGVPVAGARIARADAAGFARSGADGRFVLYLAPDGPAAGAIVVALEVTGPGGEQVAPPPVNVDARRVNAIPAIVLPHP